MDNKNQINDRTQKILDGLEKSYQKLVEFKRYKKSPLIVAKDGIIIEIQPDKILPTTMVTVAQAHNFPLETRFPVIFKAF